MSSVTLTPDHPARADAAAVSGGVGLEMAARWHDDQFIRYRDAALDDDSYPPTTRATYSVWSKVHHGAAAAIRALASEPPHPSLPRILPSMTRAEAKAELDKLEAETAAAFAEVQAAVLREREGAAALERIKAREAGR